jgi:glycosyltransferase involved in cell wall biosynthesis
MLKNSVSVIIPTFNRSQYLPRAIESVLSQLLDYDELIIVDDGSTDETPKIIEKYKGHIKYIRSEHLGAGGARNVGINAATCPLIAFLDSDDEWLPHKLDIQRSLLSARPDIICCFSNIAFQKKNGTINHFSLKSWPGVNHNIIDLFTDPINISSIIQLPKGIDDFFCGIGNIYAHLLTALILPLITVVLRRDCIDSSVRFPEDIEVYEDWEFSARLARKGVCAYLYYDTALQHAHSGQRLTDSTGPKRNDAQLTIMERVWGSDENFLSKFGQIYQNELMSQRITKVNYLLLNGHTGEARKEMKKLDRVPVYQRLLTYLPNSISGFAAKFLFGIRRRMKKILF